MFWDMPTHYQQYWISTTDRDQWASDSRYYDRQTLVAARGVEIEASLDFHATQSANVLRKRIAVVGTGTLGDSARDRVPVLGSTGKARRYG